MSITVDVTTDWLVVIPTVLASAGTLGLAIVAVFQIRKTREIMNQTEEAMRQSERHHLETIEERERERKLTKREYLLSQIINWANDISKCEVEEKFPDPPNEYPGCSGQQFLDTC